MAAWRRAALQHWRMPSRHLHLVWEKKRFCGRVKKFFSYSSSAAREIFDSGQPSFETHPDLLSSGEIMPGISAEEFALRRKNLREAVPQGSLMILLAATAKQMTSVVPYPYRQDADYLYFTGCQQPGGIAIIDDNFDLCMFMPDRCPKRELWDGRLADPLVAESVFGADRTYSVKNLPEVLPDMLQKAESVFIDISSQTGTLWSLPAILEAKQQRKIKDIQEFTHKIRWIKSLSEIGHMREVAAITCQAFLQTMLVSRHWAHERVLASTVEYECKIRGAQRMSFPPVVGGGANATVIHYSRNDNQIAPGDMVLMDAGCELHGYVSDMARCWPPSGTFSDAQKEVYELVLEAMKECFKLCKPKMTLREIHMQSGLILARGLVKLGIITDLRTIGNTYLRFNPCSVGHYLGMDVHDCAAVTREIPLEPGVIITIEPTLSIPVKDSIPERYRGIGVRIEDEVLITPTGHEILTEAVPKEVKDIESWLAQSWNPVHPLTLSSNVLKSSP